MVIVVVVVQYEITNRLHLDMHICSTQCCCWSIAKQTKKKNSICLPFFVVCFWFIISINLQHTTMDAQSTVRMLQFSLNQQTVLKTLGVFLFLSRISLESFFLYFYSRNTFFICILFLILLT